MKIKFTIASLALTLIALGFINYIEIASRPKNVIIRVLSINADQIAEKNQSRLENLAEKISRLKTRPDIIAFQEINVVYSQDIDVYDFINLLRKKMPKSHYVAGIAVSEVNLPKEKIKNSKLPLGGLGIIYDKNSLKQRITLSHNIPQGNDRKIVSGIYSKSDIEFRFASTHYPRKKKSREHLYRVWRHDNEEIVEIMGFIEEGNRSRRLSNVPKIVAGDFNFDKKSDKGTVWKSLAKKYTDTYWKIKGDDKIPTHFKKRLDYIWTKNSTIINAGIDRTNQGENYYGDHNFVWATLRLKNRNN